MRARLIQSLFVVSALTVAGSASAHFELDAPKPSSTEMNGGKGGYPCGPDDSSAVITEVMGGSMLEIKIRETTYHPGHYRVALAVNSRDELDPTKGGLAEPVVKNAQGMVLENKNGSGDSETAEIQNPPVFPVLADGLFPHTSDMDPFTGMVPIPNMNCAKCTLQVIEFMSKHGPDYFYRHCADIKITADPNKPIMGAGGSGGMGGMGGTGGASSGGMGGAASGGTPAGGTGPVGTAGLGTAGMAAGMAGTGTAGSGTAGSVTGLTSSGDDGGCTLAAGEGEHTFWAGLVAGLLGLGWLSRRRNRAA